MLRHAMTQFRAMRPSVKALVSLYWIYAFAGGMVGVFTQLFLFQRFGSIALNVVATMAAYTGIMAGFCVPGILASIWHINLKRAFLWSFIVIGASILYFPHAAGATETYAALFLWGFGEGLFYLTMNTFELSETEDRERDFYSSVSSAGSQILSLAGPATATLLIWLSGTLWHIGTYTLLFTAAPAVYLLGFFCFSSIRDYHPPAIRLADIVHFFGDRKNQAVQVYTMGMGFQQILGTIAPSLVILAILGTALRVGVYNTLFAVFSALCVLAVARYRTPKNRLFIYGITVAGLAAATAGLGYAFSFAALIVYTLVEGTLSPLMSVSIHVMDLTSMEIGRNDTDFYPTMILRDFFLWVWRTVGGFAFLGIIAVSGTGHAALSAGLYLLAGGLLATYTGAFLLLRVDKRVESSLNR